MVAPDLSAGVFLLQQQIHPTRDNPTTIKLKYLIIEIIFVSTVMDAGFDWVLP
jgi:hypothetical protein